MTRDLFPPIHHASIFQRAICAFGTGFLAEVDGAELLAVFQRLRGPLQAVTWHWLYIT